MISRVVDVELIHDLYSLHESLQLQVTCRSCSKLASSVTIVNVFVVGPIIFFAIVNKTSLFCFLVVVIANRNYAGGMLIGLVV